MVCPDAARVDAAEFRHIKIKHGTHAKAWEKNVVGVGLSNGFIEPLESTGLMLTHEAIVKLVAALTMRKGVVTKFDIDIFNHAFQEQILGFKHFISQHYALSQRNDTPYWQHVTGKTSYSPAMESMEAEMYNSYVDIAQRQHRSRVYDPSMSGIVYIAAGMGYNPMDAAHKKFLDKKYMEPANYEQDVYKRWQEHRDHVLQIIDSLPTHREFLEHNIYSKKQ